MMTDHISPRETLLYRRHQVAADIGTTLARIIICGELPGDAEHLSALNREHAALWRRGGLHAVDSSPATGWRTR